MDITYEAIDQIINEILSQVNGLKPIQISDIPNLDLYMDQLTTFMENELKDYRRNDSDKILTKTMINNYTKNKVLPVSTKKKYALSQVTRLIMIYHLKPILSLSDISLLLNDNTQLDPAAFYEAFVKLQCINAESVESDILEKLNHAKEMAAAANSDNNEGKTVLLLTALSLILEANTKKLFAEKLIDSCFSTESSRKKN